MLVIRLTRVGKKNSPAYRVVVADKRKAVKRKFIEILGNYNPTANPKTLVINKERALFWVGRGAQPSNTVNNLMVRLEILPKKNIIKKVYGRPIKKKDTGKTLSISDSHAERGKESPKSTEPAQTPDLPESPEIPAENSKTPELPQESQSETKSTEETAE